MGRQAGHRVPEEVCGQACQPQGGAPADEGQRPDGPVQRGPSRQAGAEDAQAGHGHARHGVGDGHDQDQNRAGMGLCACRPRLGEQEPARAEASPTSRSFDWI